MVYSLVNASAIGFDVVRRPAGARLAEILLAALTAPPVLLWELAAAHPAADLAARDQREWLAAAALMRGARAATPPAPHTARGHPDTDTPASWTQLSSDLARSTLGRGPELDRLIATDLLGHDTDIGLLVPAHVHQLAADIFAEAAVTAWTADHRDPSDAAHATLHQAVVTCRLPAGIDLGPHTDRLMDLLAQIPDTAAHWATRRPVGPIATDPLVWAQAMHEAAWAAKLSGRVRPAAAAQLLAAAALTATQTSHADLAGGLWNAISAHVAATALHDLLPSAAADVLAQFSPSPRR